MPAADEALPGRAAPIPTAREHFVNGQRAEGSLSGGARNGDVRARLLLGRGAQVLGARRRRLCHRGRLRRRPHAQPDLRGGLQRPYRPQRGRARRLRPEQDFVRAVCSRRSGKATIRPRACARATTSARSTGPASTCFRRSSAPPPKHRKAAYAKALAAERMGPITTEIREARRFISPRIITSNIWQKIRGAIAGSAAPA